jgi:SynChlorMet cassette radical SAM/SPASM protein ScmF
MISETSKTYPLNRLYFYLTEGCNLACCHCWLAPYHEKGPAVRPCLPADLFRKIVQDAKPLGLSAVKLTGGEPLLHPHFRELLSIIGQEGLELNIETNGVLCSPDIAAEIGKIPKAFVSVSIDGADARTHDGIRGVTGAFEEAWQGVTHLVQAGVRPQIIMCLMRRNMDQIESLVRMAEDMGAESVKFNVVQPVARGEKLLNALPDISDIIQRGRYVDMELAPRSSLRLVFDYPAAFRPLSRMAQGDRRNVCGISSILGVLPQGQYALCGIGTHVPDLVFGRAGQDSLEKVWRETPVLNALREGLPGRLQGICSQCLMKEVCLGACVAQNYYRTQNLWAPFWFCQEANEKGLFPQTRRLPDKQ